LTTSVLGGYAFARLRFPGRDALFVLYLGTIMIPFVVLVTPMYQLMVAIGWVDKIVALIVPWIFSAYGTFLMRQFFITIPREIEEAALIDGASRLQILWRIFLPASTPALATLTTFVFLYAWNSFFWPLVVINTGNVDNHVLTLSLNVLRGRASDSPNLILAGAAIAILPPMIIYILGQRFFVESATSSAVKG
jgi:multiple sugar transport system permease protein